MNGKEKARVVAISSVVVSLITILLLLSITDGAKILPRAVRFVATCVFAFFLWRGANWSRLLTGILSLISVFGMIYVVFSLLSAGSVIFSAFGLWTIFLTGYYAWVAYLLLFDSDVSEFFNPISGY